MSEQLRPEEAAQALAEIEQRQRQVIRLVTIPAWFWWSTAGLMVVFSAAIESRRPLIIGIGVTVFVVGLVASIGAVIYPGIRHAQPRNDLMPPAGVFAILGLVAAVLAVTLPTAFTLEAMGVRYAATIGSLAGGVMFVIGGPILSRYLHRVMRTHVTGDR